MPTIALYEFCTASGWGADPGDARHSMWREGKAMRDALADDFRRAGWAVTVAETDSDREFGDISARHDATIVIAPETGGHLELWVAEARKAGATVWAGTPQAIRICADKYETAHALQAAGVPTPRVLPRDSGEWPRVFKPADGAGSTDTYLVADAAAAAEARSRIERDEQLEVEYVPGFAASAAFIIGPGGVIALPACAQHLSDDGRFRYLGGATPIDRHLARRAESLARRAVEAVPGLAGFVGVDLVLGARDVVVEINPRLCTSYLGLRELCLGNLAAAWAAVATGRPAPALGWRDEVVAWSVSD